MSPKKVCEKCDLVLKRMAYQDAICFAGLCMCGDGVVIWKKHSLNPSMLEMQHMITVLRSTLGGNYLDKDHDEGKGHYHIHSRWSLKIWRTSI